LRGGAAAVELLHMFLTAFSEEDHHGRRIGTGDRPARRGRLTPALEAALKITRMDAIARNLKEKKKNEQRC